MTGKHDVAKDQESRTSKDTHPQVSSFIWHVLL